MDEATSLLDYENRYNIRNVLKLLLMDKSKIVQQGSLTELIRHNEGYLVLMTKDGQKKIKNLFFSVHLPGLLPTNFWIFSRKKDRKKEIIKPDQIIFPRN